MQWGARCNSAGLVERGDEVRGGQPGRNEVNGLAEIEGGVVKGDAADGRPEVEWIPVGATGEAVVDLPGKMDGEGPVGRGVAAGDRARATKLRTVLPGRMEAEQAKDSAHGDLSPKLAVADAAWQGLIGQRCPQVLQQVGAGGVTDAVALFAITPGECL